MDATGVDRKLTVAAAARMTGLPPSAIKKLIAAGELATVKLPPLLGIKAIIPESAVEELAARMRGERHEAG